MVTNIVACEDLLCEQGRTAGSRRTASSSAVILAHRFLFESFDFLFSGHFTWEKYLKETCAIAAPAHCFKQVRG